MDDGINTFLNNCEISYYMNGTFTNALTVNNYYTLTNQNIKKTFKN